MGYSIGKSRKSPQSTIIPSKIDDIYQFLVGKNVDFLCKNPRIVGFSNEKSRKSPQFTIIPPKKVDTYQSSVGEIADINFKNPDPWVLAKEKEIITHKQTVSILY